MLDEVDEGSALGGVATALGWTALALGAVALALPSIGWIPATLAALTGIGAVMLAAFSLILDVSPKGRRHARWGALLGAAAVLGQLAWFAWELWGAAPAIS